MSDSELVDIKGLSARINFPVRTIQTLKDQHKIPYFRIGRRMIRYNPGKVLEALNKFEVQALA